MSNRNHLFLIVICLWLHTSLLADLNAAAQTSLYQMRDDVQSRWISFENLTGAKGGGGITNKGAKGAAFSPVPARSEKVLMDVEGTGVIYRMWFTMSDRTPKMLRSSVLRIYWDNAETPAVEVPFGDFFGAILGEMKAFESELFSSPEGRSFTLLFPCRSAPTPVWCLQMNPTHLSALYYDINYSRRKRQMNICVLSCRLAARTLD